MAQITSNEEQSVELTDKIAAMEEELKKVCRLMYGEQSWGCKGAEMLPTVAQSSALKINAWTENRNVDFVKR